MTARHDIPAPVLENQDLGADILLLAVQAPGIATAARPGQFCMLHTAPSGLSDPLIRRPLSIHDVDGGTVLFLYRVVGRGTRLLASKRQGEEIQILGPLGHGFSASSADEEWEHLLVGGGIGMAPLLFLAKNLPRDKTIVMLGARTHGELARADAYLPHAKELIISTEDGSLGRRGLVTEPLTERIEAMARSNHSARVLACGPLPMVRAVAMLCKRRGIPCETSLEANMACGTGICLGCAVPRLGGGYLHVCTDGPVFDASLVDWETAS